MVLLTAQYGVVIAAFVAMIALAFARHRFAVPAGITMVLLAAHALLSSAVVLGGRGPIGPDGAVLGWFVAHRSVAVTAVMIGVSNAGGTVGMVVVAALTCAFLLRARRVRAAVVVAVAGAGAGLLVVVVKNVLARPRPPLQGRITVETTFSLPSGHALSSLVVLGMVAAVVVTTAAPRVARCGVTVLAGAVVVVIGVSRLYLAVHWPSDVLDGWLLGGAWLTLCICALLQLEQPTTAAGSWTAVHVPGTSHRARRTDAG